MDDNETGASVYRYLSRRTRALAAVGVAAVLAACATSNDAGTAHPAEVSANAGTASTGATKDPNWGAWQKVMSKARPPGKGCFQSAYPSTAWTEVACGAAPTRAFLPPHLASPHPLEANAAATSPGSTAHRGTGGSPTADVGDGTNFFAEVVTGISTATGSFPTVNGTLSETDPQVGPNAFTVQLNSNVFSNATTAALCGQSPFPQSQCVGEQQAVYSSIAYQSGFLIEYWLLNFGSTDCPNGWTSPPNAPGNCYLNTVSVNGVYTDDLDGYTPVPISALGSMKMAMTAGDDDVIYLAIEGKAWLAAFPTVVGLNHGYWTHAEFGVFGDNDEHTAQFGGTNTSILVNLAVEGVTPTTAAPICTTTMPANDSTLEKNSLTFPDFPNCCLASGGDAYDTPSIAFQETNVPGQTCTLCGNEGQACCTANRGTWCASASDVCSYGTCQPCGGTDQLCCANVNDPCNSYDDICQPVGFCGPTNALAVSPAALTIEEGEGTLVSNTASASVVASGYWATSGGAPLTLSACVTQVPYGVTQPQTCAPPAGMSVGIVYNDGYPDAVQVIAGNGTPVGTYEIVVTGTMNLQTVPAPPLKVTITACQPLSCHAAGYSCGTLDDGCGGIVSCEACAAGMHCISGGCYACTEETCASPKFWNPTTCSCQSCPCGTITRAGKVTCNVCKP